MNRGQISSDGSCACGIRLVELPPTGLSGQQLRLKRAAAAAGCAIEEDWRSHRPDGANNRPNKSARHTHSCRGDATTKAKRPHGSPRLRGHTKSWPCPIYSLSDLFLLGSAEPSSFAPGAQSTRALHSSCASTFRLHSGRALVIPFRQAKRQPLARLKIRILTASTSTPILDLDPALPPRDGCSRGPAIPHIKLPRFPFAKPAAITPTRPSFSQFIQSVHVQHVRLGGRSIDVHARFSAFIPSFPPPPVHVRTAPSVTCTSREVRRSPPTPASFAPSLTARRWLLPSPHTPAARCCLPELGEATTCTRTCTFWESAFGIRKHRVGSHFVLVCPSLVYDS